jgi:hypothetical protein
VRQSDPKQRAVTLSSPVLHLEVTQCELSLALTVIPVDGLGSIWKRNDKRLAGVGHDKLLNDLVSVAPSTGTITKIRQESYREIQSVAITVAVNRRRSSCGLEQTDLSGEVWSEWQDLNLRPPRPERGVYPLSPMRPDAILDRFWTTGPSGKITD